MPNKLKGYTVTFPDGKKENVSAHFYDRINGVHTFERYAPTTREVIWWKKYEAVNVRSVEPLGE